MLVKKLYREVEKWDGQEVTIQGWIRQMRVSKNVAFLLINDGSFFKPIQVVMSRDLENFDEASHLSNSSSVEVTGQLVATPKAKQPCEIQAREVKVLDLADPDYPLQNKRQTFEFLRTYPHLRSRTNTFNAVFRTRSEAAFAIHEYLHGQGYVYVHTPIITASDAEGAGEMFQATTLNLEDLPKTDQGTTDYKKDFFGRKAHLTVSGQLEVESFIMSYRNCYTFGPTFRAENSNTPRHAAEFWMIEPEMAFADLSDMMDEEEALIKYVIRTVMDRLPEEMEFFNKFINPGLEERLEQVAGSDFVRMTYTEAVKILEKENDHFEFPVHWGTDLQSEHERFLTEKVVKGPLFLIDYPKEIKAFYMRLNEDGKTVAASDMLVPGIGELIGGSQREERLDRLEAMMKEKNMPREGYEWYLDLRRFGSCKHSGFGIGFERLIMYLTGMANIRDVLPFPRTVGSLAE